MTTSENPEQISVVVKEVPFGSVAISLEDIQKLYRALEKPVQKLKIGELDQLSNLPDISEEERSNYEQAIEKSHQLAVTVIGSKGEIIMGASSGFIDKKNLPDRIATIRMENRTAYQVNRQNIDPVNWFTVDFDFRKPPLLDWKIDTSDPTPNDSKYYARGTDIIWVGGVQNIIQNWLDERTVKRKLIHKPFSYDVGLLFVGLPLSFAIMWLAADRISELAANLHSIFEAAIYVYIFVFCVWIYRMYWGYAKWVFPSVELRGEKEPGANHRYTLYVLGLGIVGSVIANLVT